jgi:hypothetical protein
MRTLTLLAVAAAAACVPPSAAAPARRDPCVVSYAAAAGDAFPLFTPPNDPGTDITGVDWRLTATDLVVTFRVPGLTAAPSPYWGDRFEADFTVNDAQHTVRAGYWRDRTSGGPVFATAARPAAYRVDGAAEWDRYPAVPTHLVADYRADSVVLTIPRADVVAANPDLQGRPLVLSRLTATAVVQVAPDEYAYGGDTAAAPTAAVLSFPACDAALRTKPAKPAPCAAVARDLVGDETSLQPVEPDRDDSLDLATVRFALDARNLTATVRVARDAGAPAGATGREYTVLVTDGKVSVRFTADPTATGARLTLPRTRLAFALGVAPSAKPALTLRTTSARTLGGAAMSTADETPPVSLSVRTCDRSR